MKINRQLNLVVPIERESQTYRVFSSPISLEVFQTYFRVISKTFARFALDNIGFVSGPRVAAMMLRDVARTTPRSDDVTANWLDGPDGVELGLMAEIRRLTNVIMPGESGWQVVPFEDAIRRKVFDADEISEVEGAICFFSVNFAVHRRSTAEAIIGAACGMWGMETTLSTLSEYKNSLTTLTQADATMPKEELSPTLV